MSRICPLQLEQGAQVYFLTSGPGTSLKASRICFIFIRPETAERQSGKFVDCVMAKPLPPPQQ